MCDMDGRSVDGGSDEAAVAVVVPEYTVKLSVVVGSTNTVE